MAVHVPRWARQAHRRRALRRDANGVPVALAVHGVSTRIPFSRALAASLDADLLITTSSTAASVVFYHPQLATSNATDGREGHGRPHQRPGQPHPHPAVPGPDQQAGPELAGVGRVHRQERQPACLGAELHQDWARLQHQAVQGDRRGCRRRHAVAAHHVTAGPGAAQFELVGEPGHRLRAARVARSQAGTAGRPGARQGGPRGEQRRLRVHAEQPDPGARPVDR